MRRYYGVLETQFESYFREAQRVPGQTGKVFLQRSSAGSTTSSTASTWR